MLFRDVTSKLSLRKKLFILASVGVLLPVMLLTYLQYRSLTELQNKTKAAFKDNFRQGLTIVEHVMKQRLTDVGTQTLSPIDGIPLSSSETAQELEKHFTTVKRSHPEIEEILVSGLTPTQSDLPALFEQAQVAQSFVDSDRQYLFAGRYLFHPLKEKQGAFAAVLLKERFISDDVIARSINETIANTGHDSLNVAITITDENQRALYSTASPENKYFLQTKLKRPFSNWKASIALKNVDLDYLGLQSVLHSAGATVLVVVFLLGGLALTLRATDREARLAQAKSNFVANVSHELKTPLALLSLFSEILELGRVKSEQKKLEYYRIIRHESRRLNKMIDNILDFAKIEAGRKTYNFAHTDMAEVIENVLSSYRYQIINSGFDVQTNIQPDLPPVVIDRDAMAQAISNLVDNAIKYSGKVKQLSIKTKTFGSDLSIEIADSGIGIPRAEQEKVFEKFYRVGNGLVHDVKGSGLGLSLVKHIVDAHKGTIAVESDVGKGSRFTILLPLPGTAARA